MGRDLHPFLRRLSGAWGGQSDWHPPAWGRLRSLDEPTELSRVPADLVNSANDIVVVRQGDTPCD
jgi:hypothetical protein